MKEIDVREKSIVEKIKKKFPQLEVAFAKRKKPGKAALVIVPLLLTALGTGVGLGIYYNQKPNEPVDVIKQDTGENHRIYLVANDKTTVPLTVKTKKRNTIGENLKDLFNLLKTDSKANTNSIKGIVPAETKVNAIEVFNDELILDVSEEFLNYEPTKEVNMLESLVYTFSEFPSINMLSIYVNGEKLEKMPQKNTLVPDFLQKNFGINRTTKNAEELTNKNMFNIYYTKKYDDVSYLIPVTQYVENEGTVESQFAKAINNSAPDGMVLATQYNYISETQDDKNNEKVNLNLKQAALKEEGVVKKDVYEMVALTFNDLEKDYEISFEIEGESLVVEGIQDTKNFEVANLIYNQKEI